MPFTETRQSISLCTVYIEKANGKIDHRNEGHDLDHRKKLSDLPVLRSGFRR